MPRESKKELQVSLAFKPNFLAAAERMCFPAAELLSFLLEGVLPLGFLNISKSSKRNPFARKIMGFGMHLSQGKKGAKLFGESCSIGSRGFSKNVVQLDTLGCCLSCPICTGQMTEALARPGQAGASPRFVLPFLYCAMAKECSNIDRMGG